MTAETGQTTTALKERVAGNWIQSYLKCTEGQESPTLFHLWVAISTIGSCLRRNVFLDMNFFKIYPNFYTILVSPSGSCRKGIAIGIGEYFLQHVDGIKIFRTKLTPEALLHFLEAEAQLVTDETEKEGEEEEKEEEEKEKKEKEEKTEKKKKKSTKYNTITAGLIVAPELSTMLGSSSYADDLKILLTDLYDNKDRDGYTTKSGGRVELFNVNVNFLGGSNPTWLAKSFSEDSFGGGFMGRSIFVYQEVGREKIPWPEKTEEVLLLEKLLIIDLQHLSRLRGRFSVTQKARDFYSDWYKGLKFESETRMSGYYERKHIHVLKLSMILSVAEDDELVIDIRHCKAAILLLDQLEAWMPDAFAYIGATMEAQVEQKVIAFLLERGGYAKSAQVLRHVRKSIKGKREFDAIIDTLCAGGSVIRYVKEKVLYIVLTEAYKRRKKNKEAKGRGRGTGKRSGASQEQEREEKRKEEKRRKNK